jgi:hypothetical protein
MTSIYEIAMGSDFKKLHPKIQERFGFCTNDGKAATGRGIMQEIWHGPPYTLPFLYVGTWRRIMFPERGKNIPFTIENYAFKDNFGRETVSWIRTFNAAQTRRFDAYMIYSESRKMIVDYLGSHEHLAVDIDLSVDKRGGLSLVSGAQRFYEGPVDFSFLMMFSGIANVCEWYDDFLQKYCIEVNVSNKTWGPLFGYKGTFDVEWSKNEPGSIPDHIQPVRQERRE